MMNSIKQKVYINILIFTSLILTLFYFGLIYFVEEEKNLSLEIINKKKEIEQLKLQSNYVIEVKNIAGENNIELETTVSARDKGQINDNFSYTHYKIKATGFPDDIMRFLACVENLKYYSEVENILFTVNSESKTKYDLADRDSEKILFSADLKIYIY